MGKYLQQEHRISITTPLGPDGLNLVAFDAREEFSRLFHVRMELFSDDPAIDPASIVGKNVTLKVDYPDDDTPRYFNGHISRLLNLGPGDRGTQYHAEVVPWLWFLTRTTDCRIFQDMSVPEIIEDVFTRLGFNDFEKSEIKGQHDKWEYCVQYRETAFNFISRLMEQEGIFYFFRHEDGRHVLVLADHAGAYMDADAEDQKVRFTPERAGDLRNDNLTSWVHEWEFRSGKWAHTDYNFEKPNNTRNPTHDILKADTSTVVNLDGNDKYELYDYPGQYAQKPDGEALAKLRMEEEEVPHDVVKATGICRSFAPGVKFSVEEHRAKNEVGASYVITSVEHSARVGSYVTGGGPAEQVYSNRFTCVPDNVVLRPARTTPKPLIQGSQTAVVVGPPNEEIWPDKYGRVKVQFHWDREGKMDDKSSCWIRCSQVAAGRNWGAMFIPRIGQEVIVGFLEGDPDRPLVTGVVYNLGQMPPYALPDEKTKSYIKTNSSKGGDGFNELRFEDKKGEEQIFVHAQRNLDVRVRNDSMERVVGSRHEIIGWEKDGKKGGSHRQEVHEDKEARIHRNRVEHVEGNLQLTVGRGEADGGQVELICEKDKKELIEGASHLTVKGNLNEKIGGDVSLQAAKQQVKLSGDWATESGGSVHIKAGMTLILEAGIQLSLKVGGNFIDIGPAGVAISGTTVLINSGGAAGSGAGAKPTSPEEPQQAKPTKPAKAAKAKTGKKSCPD